MTSEDLIANLLPLGGVLREALDHAWREDGGLSYDDVGRERADNAAALAVAKVVVEHVLRELGKRPHIGSIHVGSPFGLTVTFTQEGLALPKGNHKLYVAPHPRSEE